MNLENKNMFEDEIEEIEYLGQPSNESSDDDLDKTIIMTRPLETKEEVQNEQKKNKKFRLNIIGIVGIIALLVIGYFVFSFVRTFNETSGSPVIGKRFDNHLNPKIEQAQLKQLKEKISGDAIQNVEVNLKSATLRILVDMQDSTNLDSLNEQATKVKDILNEVLPIATYFTNREGVRMYDYEIHVYNVVKKTDDIEQVYVIKGKTGNGEEYTDTVSKERNSSIVEKVTKDPE